MKLKASQILSAEVKNPLEAMDCFPHKFCLVGLCVDNNDGRKEP